MMVDCGSSVAESIGECSTSGVERLRSWASQAESRREQRVARYSTTKAGRAGSVDMPGAAHAASPIRACSSQVALSATWSVDVKQHCEAFYVRGLRSAHLTGNVVHSPPSCGIHPNKEQAVPMLRKAKAPGRIRKRREPIRCPGVSGTFPATAMAAATFFPPVRTTEGNYRI